MTRHQLASELRVKFARDTRLPKHKVNDFTDNEIISLYNTCPSCHNEDIIPADILKQTLPDIDSAEEFLAVIANLLQMRQSGLIDEMHELEQSEHFVEKDSSENKKRIATQILRRSIELLTPISNDVKGVHNEVQKACIAAISEALEQVCTMDSWCVPDNSELTSEEDLQQALDSINEYDVTYRKDNHNLN